MITIYHNPRCRKSREGLALLEATGLDVKIVKYLDTPLSKTVLTTLIKQLQLKPIDLIRKNEAIWKSDYKHQNLSDAAIIDAMLLHPKLIERPIVTNGKNAVIGRPASLINTIL